MKFHLPAGATPITDISGLKIDWVSTQEDLNRVEAENIAFATRKYLARTVSPASMWFNLPFLRKIHRDMFDGVWEWAGEFRKTQTIPGVSPSSILPELQYLCQEVRDWCAECIELTFLEQAAKLHHKLVAIHPFVNGNGRFARLVSDRYMKACKCKIPTWPIDLGIGGEHRLAYISALKQADKGDLEALIKYLQLRGARDPSLEELSRMRSYSPSKKESLYRAYQRRGK